MIKTEFDFSDEKIEIKVFGKHIKDYEIHIGDKFCLWGNERDMVNLANEIEKALGIETDLDLSNLKKEGIEIEIKNDFEDGEQ